MKLHLPVLLFRALMAAAAFASAMTMGIAEAGVIRHDYEMQQYKDFAMNMGQYRPGATNIEVFRTDGTSTGEVISLMPSMASYAAYWRGKRFAGSNTDRGNGGATLISPHYIITAAHCGYADESTDINFLCSSAASPDSYASGVVYKGTAGYGSYNKDGLTQRLSKIVTDVAYTPLCTDDELISNMAQNGTYLYRAGNGKTSMAQAGLGIGGNVSINPGSPLGGMTKVTAVYVNHGATGNYSVKLRLNENESMPLTLGLDSGDSGSPVYVYNENTNRFETVGVYSTGTFGGYGNVATPTYNPTATLSKIDFFTQEIDLGSTGNSLIWGAQAEDGTGTLTLGESSWTYIGSNADDSNPAETKDLLFTSSAETQRIELAADIDMGTASIGFESGNYVLASQEGTDYAITNSAGYIVNAGAHVTVTLNGRGEEWRKVGEGIMTIAGSGDNNISLNVGGGYMSFDEEGNIIHMGEVRLDREGGYVATNITLSAGVTSIVLMRDGQINGNNFTFGHMGGVLNLNGHDLTWNTINTNALAKEQGSEYGATISNIAPEGLAAPGLATFTYTGKGTYKGAFEDGGSEDAGLLKVVYNAASATDSWVLTGAHKTAGGFEVQSGNLSLQGSLTLHTGSKGSLITLAGDYTYAVMETSTITVNNGATFTLADHALLQGDVVVNSGTFVLKNTVHEAEEYVGGANRREDVTDICSHIGSVSLTSADATMRVDTSSAVELHYRSDIGGSGHFEKTGSGKLLLSGNNDFSGSKTITCGTVEFLTESALGNTEDGGAWIVDDEGVMLVSGQNASSVLPHVDGTSVGVLAMDADQQTALDLSGHTGLFIGAAEGETINYGTLNTTESLTATEGAWRFGGGGGTLNVNFLLTGEGNLIIGNEFSSGTVHLANTSNDFEGDILIGGFNNFLTFASEAALGNARVAVSYGNVLGLPDATDSMLGIVKAGSKGVLALYSESGMVSRELDFVNTYASLAEVALGAVEETHYNGTLATGGNYRFGGSGTLYLDTNLTGSGVMLVDAQGLSGGRIVLNEANAFSGEVWVGGKLNADSVVETGSIELELGHADALSAAASVTLESGGTLVLREADAAVRNLVVNAGASLVNRGSETHTLTIDNEVDATWVAGALVAGASRLNLVKEGAGTLTLGANNAYEGDITILAGTVKGSSGSSTNSSFGVQAAGNSICLGENGTLDVTLYGCFGGSSSADFANTRLFQTITGTGTVVVQAARRSMQLTLLPGLPATTCWSNQTVTLFSQQEAFEGTVRVAGNTRLLIGSNLYGTSTNINALSKATVEVTAGSQVVVTDRVGGNGAANVQHCYTNFILNGSSFSGSNGSGYMDYSGRPELGVDYGGSEGALRVDCDSIVYGDITLNTDSTIASRMHTGNGTRAQAYGNASTAAGGSLLGTICGEGKTLTLAGNALLTLRADAANTYGNLNITNSKGVKFGGGVAQSTVSSAMGMGAATIGTSVNFANAETADRSIVYAYGNALTVKNAASLYGGGNTTELIGCVTMSGAGMTLGSAAEAQLNLRGGISGGSDTTVTLAAGSHVGIGGEAGSFSGTIAVEAGSELSLLSSGALAEATLNYTDSFTLQLGADTVYTIQTLTGIGTANAEGVAGATNLTFVYDFTHGSSSSSLTVTNGLTDAFNSATICVELNMAKDLQGGTYTLITNDVSGMDFTLADDFNGRISLRQEATGLYMDVASDDRLFWTAGSGSWDTQGNSWALDGQGNGSYADGKGVVFGGSGVAEGNSATSPERISLESTVTPHSVMVKDAASYSIEGAGAIEGDDTTLSVIAGASLQLATSGNRFGGGVSLHEGTLVAAAQNSLVSSSISLEDGSCLRATAADALVGNTIELSARSSLDAAAQGAVSGGNIITVGQGGTLTASATGAFIGNTITLNAGSKLHLTAENALGTGNSITFAGGLLQASADNTLGSAAAASEMNNARFAVAEGATLTHYAGSGKTIAHLEGGGNYLLNAAGATTLSDMSAFSGTITKTGAGALTVTEKSAEAEWVLLDRAWTNEVNFNNFAAEGSTIILKGANGGGSYLPNATMTFAQNFRLEASSANAYGLIITNGYSAARYTFSGELSGSGELRIARSGKNITDTYTFTGDTSAYAGNFALTQNKMGEGALTLSDNGGSTTYAHEEHVAGTGTIQLTVATPENTNHLVLNYARDHGFANAISGTGNIAKRGAGTITLTGDISGHSGQLQVQAGGITLSGNHSLNNSVSVAAGARLNVSGGTTVVGSNGSIIAASASSAEGESATEAERSLIRVSDSGALCLGEKVRVVARDTAAAAELENIALSGAGFSAASTGSIGAITGAHVSIGSLARLRTAAVAESTTLNFDNLDIVDSEIINSGTDTVVFNNAYITSNAFISNMGSGSITLVDCTLETGDALVEVVNGIGTIRLSSFDNVTLQNSLTFELSEATSGSISGNVAGGMNELHIQLSVASYTPEDFVLNLNSSSDAMLDICAYSSSQLEGGVMDIRLTFNNGAIPEPASTALALLGLAGLAVRRRRRG